MKKLLLPLFLLAILVSTAYAQETWQKVKIFSDDLRSDIEMLRKIDVIVDEGFTGKDNSISVFLTASDVEKLRSTGMRFEVVIDDWDAHYKKLPVLTPEEQLAVRQQSKQNYGVEGLTYGTMGGYYTLAEINAQLDSMRALPESDHSEGFDRHHYRGKAFIRGENIRQP